MEFIFCDEPVVVLSLKRVERVEFEIEKVCARNGRNGRDADYRHIHDGYALFGGIRGREHGFAGEEKHRISGD